MSTAITWEHLATLVMELSPAERLRLVERIARDLAERSDPLSTSGKRPWRELQGIVSYPLCGEDAQDWVSKTRRESDAHRGRPGDPTP